MTTVNEALLEIAAKLVALAGGPEVVGGEVGKPGMIAVRPTGVYGQGKVRYYPPAYKIVPNTNKPELAWSYALRMAMTEDEFGKTYVPSFKKNEAGSLFQKVAPDPTRMDQYPEFADRWGYEEDWWSAEEIKKRLDAGAQWKEAEDNMRG